MSTTGGAMDISPFNKVNYHSEKDYSHINKVITDEDKARTQRRRLLEHERDLKNMTREVWDEL